MLTTVGLIVQDRVHYRYQPSKHFLDSQESDEDTDDAVFLKKTTSSMHLISALRYSELTSCALILVSSVALLVLAKRKVIPSFSDALKKTCYIGGAVAATDLSIYLLFRAHLLVRAHRASSRIDPSLPTDIPPDNKYSSDDEL